jgi:hypothetical protein
VIVSIGPHSAIRIWRITRNGEPLFWKMPITMPRGPSEHVVTKFLQHALAAHALGITELDAKARAAGLLGEHQSITTAKVFKRAKKSLGITSRRTGFGAESKWHWQMPPPEQQNESSVEARPEPAPARRIPVDWLEGIACLDDGKPPSDVPRHRWRQFVEDCREFLSSPEWAWKADRLGWDAMALFGCAPKRPLDYSGSAGLLWAINGGRLVELHRDWAVIELAANGSRRVFERRRVDAGNVTLPWIERGRRPGGV